MVSPTAQGVWHVLIISRQQSRFSVGVKSRLQCAGLNRHEVEDERALRVRTSDPLGPESCGAAREGVVEALTGGRRGRYSAPKRCNPDAAAVVMSGRQHEQER